MTAGKKILLVDDDIIIAMTLEMLLKKWGYEICEPATSAKEAISKAESERPDMILMDVNIKGKIDGIGAAREIISRFGIPVIFMSGYTQSEIKKKAGMDCVVEVLSKPLDLEKLKLTLESITPGTCEKNGLITN